MKLHEFEGNSSGLANAWAHAMEKACETLDFDLQCLDWFSYNPDFFIENKNVKAA